MLLVAVLILLSHNLRAKELVLNKQNTVVMDRQLTPGEGFRIVDQLNRLNAARGSKKYPLYLVLACPGGYMSQADIILRHASAVKNLHTVTLEAASACAFIAQLLPGKRYIDSSGIYMLHETFMIVRGGKYTKDDLRGLIQQLDKDEQIYKRISKRAKMDHKKFRAKLKSDWTIPAKEALNSGLADKIIDVSCTSDLDDKLEQASKMMEQDPLILKYAKCIAIGE